MYSPDEPFFPRQSLERLLVYINLQKRSVFILLKATRYLNKSSFQHQLSIYPNPTPEIVLVESPSELENRIAVVRRKVCQTYTEAHAHVHGWISTWVGVEHAVERSSLYYYLTLFFFCLIYICNHSQTV